jgi:hypothetical protein
LVSTHVAFIDQAGNTGHVCRVDILTVFTHSKALVCRIVTLGDIQVDTSRALPDVSLAGTQQLLVTVVAVPMVHVGTPASHDGIDSRYSGAEEIIKISMIF